MVKVSLKSLDFRKFKWDNAGWNFEVLTWWFSLDEKSIVYASKAIPGNIPSLFSFPICYVIKLHAERSEGRKPRYVLTHIKAYRIFVVISA